MITPHDVLAEFADSIDVSAIGEIVGQELADKALGQWPELRDVLPVSVLAEIFASGSSLGIDRMVETFRTRIMVDGLADPTDRDLADVLRSADLMAQAMTKAVEMLTEVGADNGLSPRDRSELYSGTVDLLRDTANRWSGIRSDVTASGT